MLKNDKSGIVEKFQIFSKIQGARKEFMIVPRLLEMHRALQRLQHPIKEYRKFLGEVDFRLSNASPGKL